MLFTLTFPAFDPVLVQFGPFAIRWYALAYVVGILLGWTYTRRLARRGDSPLTEVMLDDFVTWAVLGIILGGRIGYILFYMPGFYASDPLQVFAVWRGGMSFHGGLIGMILAMALFARRRGIRFFHLTDAVAAATPIGLFLGRLANFVNGELYGRPTDVPWAMIFPKDPAQLPRHPSQLYEAGLEGLLLFIFLTIAAWHFRALRRPGLDPAQQGLGPDAVGGQWTGEFGRHGGGLLHGVFSPPPSIWPKSGRPKSGRPERISGSSWPASAASAWRR